MTGESALEQASKFIKDNNDFLVISHVNPDGDAIGSLLAVIHLLKNIGKRYTVVNEVNSPNRFSFLQGFDEIKDLSKEHVTQRFSQVITVDAADWERLGKTTELINKEMYVLNIDHHPTNTLFGYINVIDSQAASTTQILYDLIEGYFPNVLNTDIATPLYTGLVTDTGCFRYSNTTQKVLQTAAHLLSFDVQPAKISEIVLETISIEQFELLKQSLQNLTLYSHNKVGIIEVTAEDIRRTGASKEDTDGLVSYPRMLKGVEVAAVLKEINHSEIKVSLRSKYEINVSEIAQFFGGGGHAKASGYTFIGTLKESKQALLQHIDQILGES